MVFSSLEWIVIVFAALSFIKLIIILTNRREWLPVVKEVYGGPRFFSPILFVLAALMFWILWQHLSLVEIMAVMAFTAVFIALALLQYGQEVIKLAKKSVSVKIKGWLLFYLLVWIALLVCTLYTIFAK